MRFDISSGIPNDWMSSIQDFEAKHAVALSNKYPMLIDKVIKVNILDSQKNLAYDRNNPIQANLEEFSIGYSDNDIELDALQREALIAHEIGHLINKGVFEDDPDRLEIECDKVAVILGLNKSLKDALTTLRESYLSQASDPFIMEYYKEHINSQFKKIDQRIKLL